MIDRFVPWWRARTPREQGLLVLLLLIAVPMVLWYAVVRPIDGAIERAQLSRDADARSLADVLRLAGKVRAARSSVRVDGRPLEGVIAAEAARAGFGTIGVQRDGTGVAMSIEAVRSQPFFAWLAALKQRRGLFVTRLEARRNDDATLSVSVRFDRAR